MSHKKVRENDEYACTCGLRWGLHETDPHFSSRLLPYRAGKSCTLRNVAQKYADDNPDKTVRAVRFDKASGKYVLKTLKPRV